MKKEKTLKEYVVEYLDDLSAGQLFSPKDVCTYIELMSDGERSPLDSTVTRTLRRLREEGYEWTVVDNKAALYKKGKYPAKKKEKGPKPYSYKY